MQEFMVEPLHIGSHVLVQGLVSKAHLNGKHGFVYGQRGDDRWLVESCSIVGDGLRSKQQHGGCRQFRKSTTACIIRRAESHTGRRL